jgi:predicted HTH domain antitoxin
MSEIRVHFEEELLLLLGESPEEIERHALELIVLDLYRQRKLSVGRAAALLGLDQLSFIRWSGERGVPFFDMTAEEWERERQTVEKA